VKGGAEEQLLFYACLRKWLVAMIAGWVGDDGTECQEYTLVIYLSDTTEDQVHAAADELIRVFNQSSILIQANPTKTEFYSAK